MRTWTLIVACLTLSSTAIAWQSIPMTAEDGVIRHSALEAEGYELWHDRHDGRNFYTEYRWWGFDADEGDILAQAAFWWAEDGGWWNKDLIHKNGFLKNFGSVRDSPGMGLSTGPTIETVLGEVGTTMFDVDTRTYGEDIRECIGFRFFWERRRDSYVKLLDFYVCGKEGGLMTEERFIEVLSGLSIEGEFDALVD